MKTQIRTTSSRSHMILHLTVTIVLANGQSCQGVGNFAELAGSESQRKRLAKGQRFKEAKNINLSLSTLQRNEEITRLENKMESLKENTKLRDKEAQLQKKVNNFTKTHQKVLSIQHELAFLKTVYDGVREKNVWQLVIHLYIHQVQDNMECYQNIQILVQNVLLVMEVVMIIDRIHVDHNHVIQNFVMVLRVIIYLINNRNCVVDIIIMDNMMHMYRNLVHHQHMVFSIQVVIMSMVTGIQEVLVQFMQVVELHKKDNTGNQGHQKDEEDLDHHVGAASGSTHGSAHRNNVYLSKWS